MAQILSVVSDTGTTPVNYGTIPVSSKVYRAFVVTTDSADNSTITVPGPTAFTGQFDVSATGMWCHKGAPGANPPVLGTSVSMTTADSVATFWIPFTAVDSLDNLSGTNMTFHSTGLGGGDFNAPIAGQGDVARTLALQMVLDRSGSMGDLVGGGEAKYLKLIRACNVCGTVLHGSDGLGAISFDDALYDVLTHTPFRTVTAWGGTISSTFDAASPPSTLTPRNTTGIGMALSSGDTTLTGVTGFARKALLLVTDGLENTGTPRTTDSGFTVGNRLFVIGIGTTSQIDTTTLGHLTDMSGSIGTNATGGYLQVTGDLSVAGAPLFALQKYLLQMVADASQKAVVVDPDGTVVAGRVERVPFHVSEGETVIDVILLSTSPADLYFVLKTPGGELIDPSSPATEASVKYIENEDVSLYRLKLPALHAHKKGSYVGKWEALITMRSSIDRGLASVIDVLLNEVKNEKAKDALKNQAFQKAPPQPPIPYSLSVQAQTEIYLTGDVFQKDHAPGSSARLVARLLEYGMPIPAARASVHAEITWPDGSAITAQLKETTPGRYRLDVELDGVGAYKVRFLAAGKSMFGSPFTREAIRTATITLGIPVPTIPPSEGGGKPGTTGTGGTGTTGGTGGVGGAGGGYGTPDRCPHCGGLRCPAPHDHHHGCGHGCHGHGHHHHHGGHCGHGSGSCGCA